MYLRRFRRKRRIETKEQMKEVMNECKKGGRKHQVDKLTLTLLESSD